MIKYKEFLSQVTNQPGVYQMINAKGRVVYVGKAKNLKKRLSSYFLSTKIDAKTQALLSHVDKIETTVTSNEVEALLLEYNLIKALKPRYNIVFKDDRSYPYILISDHEFPYINIYRGTPKDDGFYFGPFTNNQVLYETMHFLRKTFQIRQCDDTVFRNRTRPCLQYQMSRCTAPCTGCISKEGYARNIDFVKKFLEGKNSVVIQEIIKLMEKAAANLDFEKAAYYRDQIASLKKAQLQQCIVGGKDQGNIDVLVMKVESDIFCTDILSIRNGLVLGNKTFINQVPHFMDQEEILATFLVQYYSERKNNLNAPQKIITNVSLSKNQSLQEAIDRILNKKIKIIDKVKLKLHKQWLNMAENNGDIKLKQYLSNNLVIYQNLCELKNILRLKAIPQRIECFDVSHSSGDATVASCVAFGSKGLLKNQYRKFNIKKVSNDDYMALAEATERHFTRILKEKTSLPDVLIIDGGKGQLKVVSKVLQNLHISSVFLLAIAKGKERIVGAEQIYTDESDQPLPLQSNPLLLNFLLRIRDQAHRFAITAHRQRLTKSRTTSVLEKIAGVGKKRRDVLLKQFGGIQGIKAATVDDLTNVKGINKKTAELVYQYLHT